MTKNMGIADRVIRVLVAIAITLLYMNGVITGTLGIVLLIVGGIFLATSLINFCPLYALFGISTCKVE